MDANSHSHNPTPREPATPGEGRGHASDAVTTFEVDSPDATTKVVVTWKPADQDHLAKLVPGWEDLIEDR